MIDIQIAKNFPDVEVSTSKIEELIKVICNRFKLPNVTVSVAIVDDAQMRRVNNQFLNRKSTTDCLSFDLSDPAPARSAVTSDPCSTTSKSFEIVVNGELAVKEANQRGHSPQAELALYIIHGLLHNLGFDDATENQAKKMHAVENEILQQLGYGVVYNKNRY